MARITRLTCRHCKKRASIKRFPYTYRDRKRINICIDCWPIVKLRAKEVIRAEDPNKISDRNPYGTTYVENLIKTVDTTPLSVLNWDPRPDLKEYKK